MYMVEILSKAAPVNTAYASLGVVNLLKTTLRLFTVTWLFDRKPVLLAKTLTAPRFSLSAYTTLRASATPCEPASLAIPP